MQKQTARWETTIPATTYPCLLAVPRHSTATRDKSVFKAIKLQPLTERLLSGLPFLAAEVLLWHYKPYDLASWLALDSVGPLRP